MPKPEETAVLTIDGVEWREWETISVHAELPGMPRIVKATVSEDSPLALSMAKAKIKPGMSVSVTLAGQLAMTGFIYERQLFLDANRHVVQITGQSLVADLSKGDVDHEKVGEGGEFKNKSLVQITQEVVKPFGIQVAPKGKQDGMNLPFEDAQVMVGETAYHFIERLARTRATFLGDDANGAFVLYGGMQGGGGGGGGLIEGENIQWERVTISDLALRDPHTVYGQAKGDDEKNMKDVSEPKLTEKGDAKRYMPDIYQLERALGRKTMDQEMKLRNQFEMQWNAMTMITAEIGVYLWTRPGGGLWEVGAEQLVHVKSPSAMLDEDLAVQQVTWTQDNSGGTMTLLNLVNPKFFGGAGTQW